MIDRRWHESQLRTFASLQPELSLAASELDALLRALAASVAPTAKVYVRVKSILSVSEKILRGENPTRHPEPMDGERGLTDLIGGQIVCYTQHDRNAVCDFIERLGRSYLEKKVVEGIEIDQLNSGDTQDRLRSNEFGYTARHFIVRLHGAKLLGQSISRLAGLRRRFEVQVKTAISQAWTEVIHDRTYKSDLRLPSHLQRRVAEAKAMLDNAEREMEEALVELDRYRGRYAGWQASRRRLQPDELQREKLVFESVLSLHPSDDRARSTALIGLSEVAIAEGDWKRAEELLDQVLELGVLNPKQLRDMRVSLADVLLRGGKAGTASATLDAVLQDDPTQGDAARVLAELWLSSPNPTADVYSRVTATLEPAFLASPDEPGLLLDYTTARLLRDRDAARLCTMRGVCGRAVAECRRRFELGVDVPECLLIAARLSLFADDVFDACNTYCLAWIHHPPRQWVEHELHVLDLLQDRIQPDDKEERVSSIRVGIECAVGLLRLLLRDEASQPSVPQHLSRRPIVIVAGGCDPRDDARLHRFADLIRGAFDGFEGTIISGGTTSGISGLVGEIARASGFLRRPKPITAVGYLPPYDRVAASGDHVDSRYDHIIHVTPGQPGGATYTPLGPVRTWSDLLRSGVDPSHVRVIGYNGGIVSAFEFRLALAVGASVGLIEDTGRAVESLLSDPHWRDQPGVHRLLNDVDTVRMYIRTAGAREPAAHVEPLAQFTHKQYCETRLSKPGKLDPALAEWDSLSDSLKSSNREQVIARDFILATRGFMIVPESDPRPAIDLSDEQFNEDLLAMARLEHGRWNAEKLAAGFRPGAARDDVRKTNPSIVPWDQLPDEIKRYDFDPFRTMAGHLRKLTPPMKVVRLGDARNP